MFEEELGKIGLTLDEAYGTPGQGGMYLRRYFNATSIHDNCSECTRLWSILSCLIYYARFWRTRNGEFD
jgi:hypothetical protein